MLPRFASISSTGAATGCPFSAAASFSASQNGSSSEIDVLCPAMVKERLSGFKFTLCKTQRHYATGDASWRPCGTSPARRFYSGGSLAFQRLEPLILQTALGLGALVHMLG